MEDMKIINKDIENIVKQKYPDYESKDRLTKSKLFVFKKVINDYEKNKFIKNFVTSYEINTNNYLTADDILNITYSYKINPKETKELKIENIKFYLELVKEIQIDGILMLNKILLSNEVIKRMKAVRNKFNDEQEFRNYNDEILITELFKYKILLNTGIDKDMALLRIKNEIISILDNKINEKDINNKKTKILTTKRYTI